MAYQQSVNQPIMNLAYQETTTQSDGLPNTPWWSSTNQSVSPDCQKPVNNPEQPKNNQWTWTTKNESLNLDHEKNFTLNLNYQEPDNKPKTTKNLWPVNQDYQEPVNEIGLPKDSYWSFTTKNLLKNLD